MLPERYKDIRNYFLPVDTEYNRNFYKIFKIDGIEIMQRISDNYINATYLDYQLRLGTKTEEYSKNYYINQYLRNSETVYFRASLRERKICDADTMPELKHDKHVYWFHPILFFDFFYNKGTYNRLTLLMHFIKTTLYK